MPTNMSTLYPRAIAVITRCQFTDIVKDININKR